MVDLTGPAAIRLSRSGVARRPRLRFQCDNRAPRFRRCRCRICRAKLRRPLCGVRETKLNTRRASSTVISGYFPPQSVSLQNQPVMRQKRQGCMVVPSQPRAGFVVTEARFVLSLAMALFNGPSREGGSQQLLFADVGSRVAQEILRLLSLVERVRNEKPALRRLRPVAPTEKHPQQCRSNSNGTLTGVADFVNRPRLGRQLLRQDIDVAPYDARTCRTDARIDATRRSTPSAATGPCFPPRLRARNCLRRKRRAPNRLPDALNAGLARVGKIQRSSNRISAQ